MTDIPYNKRYDSRVYADYEFDDETSQFDPLGVWVGGTEYYSRTYRCRVPRRLLEKCEKSGDIGPIERWIDNNSDKGIWK